MPHCSHGHHAMAAKTPHCSHGHHAMAAKHGHHATAAKTPHRSHGHHAMATKTPHCGHGHHAMAAKIPHHGHGHHAMAAKTPHHSHDHHAMAAKTPHCGHGHHAMAAKTPHCSCKNTTLQPWPPCHSCKNTTPWPWPPCGGQKHRLEEFYSQFMQHLKIERLGRLKKHLGVWWARLTDKNNGEVYLHASLPKMVQEIKDAYTHTTRRNAKEAKTPAYPGTCLKQATEAEDAVKTTEYHSIIGKLMYCMIKVVPEIANVVRELVGKMINPNGAHWKAVDQAVGCVLSEPYQGLTF